MMSANQRSTEEKNTVRKLAKVHIVVKKEDPAKKEDFG